MKTFEEAKLEHESLKKELRYHDDLYYNKANPEISDAEYDLLRKRLNELEALYPTLKNKDSASFDIGASVEKSRLQKITHKKPMLSLDNAFDIKDMESFIDRLRKLTNKGFDFCGEQKIDGLSASIFYRNGKIQYAATRGDGFTGENITENIKTIRDIPQEIPHAGDIEIRGEVYMSIASFQELNKARDQSNESLFSNPRNAAAGSLRQLDPKITASRNLSFFAYFIDDFGGGLELQKQTDVLSCLCGLGFKIAEHRFCRDINDIVDFYEHIQDIRKDLPYEIDGTVFKINSLELQEELGYIGRTPRHSIAFKFPAEIETTKILDIVVQVGRTGKITPVAIVEPVELGGAIVSRATLHNFDEVRRKGICIGSTVKILRSGDVIPKIIEVVESSNECDIKIPKVCPSCGSELVHYEGLVDLFCVNQNACPAQLLRYLTYFVSKQCFDINGLSEKQLQEFLKEGRIKSAIDIFKLKEKEATDPLASQPGWGKVSANKLYEAIEKSKNISLPKFITSLGISGIGEVIAKLLSKEFETFENFQNATRTDLISIEGLGELLTSEVLEYFGNKDNQKFLKDLLQVITIEPYKMSEPSDTSSMFYEKNIIFTGTLSSMSRSDAKALAEKAGAKVVSSISKKTDFVIAGFDPGSKLQKARDLNIRIINEEEFLKMI